jgi:CHAT domain-containing protein
MNWGRWAFQRRSWNEAARAYDYAETAISDLVKSQSSRRNKEIWLRDVQGVAAHAAYSFANTGKFMEAAVALDNGQTRIVAEGLRRDAVEIDALRSRDPNLCQRFAAARAELRLIEQADLGLVSDRQPPESWHSAQSNFERLIDEIRGLKGFENFLRPIRFTEIRAASAEAPLVYLTATEAGALALIVHGGRQNGATPVWLPQLTNTALRSALLRVDESVPESVLAGTTSSELVAMHHKGISGYWGRYTLWRSNPRNPEIRQRWLSALDETANWLWLVAMQQVVEFLTSEGECCAILVPQGILGVLPLHIAWTRDEQVRGGRRYALDSIAFSYVPNSQALANAQRSANKIRAEGLLAIDEPFSVTAIRLPNSSREVENAASTFDRPCILKQENATRAAVLELLPHYSVLHFSGHAYANVLEPLDSGIAMANDELLTLRHLLGLNISPMRLAIFSACETGIRGFALPDEAVSLPTGLLLAGFAGVVASLWSVTDVSTALLMGQFYKLWRNEGLTPPVALNEAQKWLRDAATRGEAAYDARNIGVVAHAEAIGTSAQHSPPRDFAHPFWWGAFAFTGV